MVAHFSSTDPDYANADSAPLTFTIAQAPLTITANDRSKTYGDALALGSTAFTTGAGQLVSGDSVTGVMLSSDGAAADAPVAGSPYAIVPSGAAGRTPCRSRPLALLCRPNQRLRLAAQNLRYQPVVQVQPDLHFGHHQRHPAPLL